eukprot:12222873-Karenia_brevis.AAC.1
MYARQPSHHNNVHGRHLAAHVCTLGPYARHVHNCRAKQGPRKASRTLQCAHLHQELEELVR